MPRVFLLGPTKPTTLFLTFNEPDTQFGRLVTRSLSPRSAKRTVRSNAPVESAAMSSWTGSDQIYIYAELLSNIRQVSVAVVLPSPSSTTTTAQIVDNGSQLSVEHNGQSETIILPWAVLPHAVLPIPKVASTEISWRLPLSPAAPIAPPFSPENQVIPWAASDLQDDAPVSCRTCESIIIPSGTIATWKDLPSENWAEMMEFWHCHKPHDHQHTSSDDDPANKAYGANSAIAAQSNVGFVDISSFMFDEIDCSNLLVSNYRACEPLVPFNIAVPRTRGNRRWPNRL